MAKFGGRGGSECRPLLIAAHASLRPKGSGYTANSAVKKKPAGVTMANCGRVAPESFPPLAFESDVVLRDSGVAAPAHERREITVAVNHDTRLGRLRTESAHVETRRHYCRELAEAYRFAEEED